MAAKRSKNQARRNGGNGIPGWMWLLVGLLIGALAFGYLFLKDKWAQGGSDLPQPNPQAQAPRTSEGAEPVVPETPVKPKPKFEFFEILPGKEVVIPDAELAEQARAEALKPTPTPANPASETGHPDQPSPPTTTPAVAANADGARYLLQAGAFRSVDEAEALKAKIALTGEVARVETAEINGNTVYRVRMGPYPTAGGLAAAKQALNNHGITGALPIRAK
ncbi:SPOR domain-containing protein [Arenimonas oryziterrae]|uniref:SPOR domain-containing protein n=1 Tax=Arenimonas oryziterrae DSM 21050 = YC6267 TaxID=1121015 RepID=A0A091AX40_9GAMM|nr:SPOR domain-containing protein [Arenimonas oryziterrae]KFN43976.1 hypothetical protein N789_08480 [Arenimonas oryziterrae DSM 21050 = YC6267]